MPAPRHSKRFNPNAITERVIPVLLVLLLLILSAVVIIVVWSLVA